ncbi:MAG: hypothetical protein WB697_21940 [Stellaceae bacterium]
MASEAHLKELHSKSRHNRASLARSKICGCFYCFNQYPFAQIAQWIDDDETAVCPCCGVDAVLGFAAPTADQDLLHKLHDRWFKQPVRLRSDEWEKALRKDRWPKAR